MAEENVISIVIRAVDQMSAELKQAQNQLDQLSGAAKRTSVETGNLERGTTNVNRAIVPLRRSVGQITNAIAVLNPETRTLVGSFDNLAFAALGAASGATTFSGALAAGIAAILNPYTLAILAVVAAVGYLISKYQAAKQALNDYEKSAVATSIAEAQIGVKNKERLIDIEKEIKLSYIRAQVAKGNINETVGALQVLGAIDEANAKKSQQGFENQEHLREVAISSIRGQADELDALNQSVQTLAAFLGTLPEDFDTISAAMKRASDLRISALEKEVALTKEAAQTEAERAALDTDAARKIAAEKIKLEMNIFNLKNSLNEQFDQRVHARQKVTMLVAQTEVDITKQQVGIAEQLNLPYEIRFGLVQKLIGAEHALLQEQIDQQFQNQANLDMTKANFEQEALFISKTIDALERKKQLVGVEMVNALKQQEDAARSVAQGFMDRFLQISAAGSKGFAENLKTTLLDIAKTVNSQIMEELLTRMIVTLKIPGFGEGKNVGQTIVDQIFGLSPAAAAAKQFAANMTVTATTVFVNGSVVGGVPAAGGSLAGAGINLAGDTGTILDFSKILEEDLLDFDFSAMTDALDIAFGESVDTLGSAMETLFGEGGSLLESILGLFSGIGTTIGSIFGFAHGGMVIPQGALSKFQHGGMVRNGPVMGIVGEEGPELVARMKPAGSKDMNGGEDINQTFYFVDQRPGRIGPHDIVQVISSDMTTGGSTSKAVKHVIRRHGSG